MEDGGLSASGSMTSYVRSLCPVQVSKSYMILVQSSESAEARNASYLCALHPRHIPWDPQKRPPEVLAATDLKSKPLLFHSLSRKAHEAFGVKRPSYSGSEVLSTGFWFQHLGFRC